MQRGSRPRWEEGFQGRAQRIPTIQSSACRRKGREPLCGSVISGLSLRGRSKRCAVLGMWKGRSCGPLLRWFDPCFTVSALQICQFLGIGTGTGGKKTPEGRPLSAGDAIRKERLNHEQARSAAVPRSATVLSPAFHPHSPLLQHRDSTPLPFGFPDASEFLTCSAFHLEALGQG
jgi:hypothetical protein